MSRYFNSRDVERMRSGFNSLFAIWGVDPLGLDPLPFKSQKITNPRSSCLTVVSPRGSNEAKETAGMNGFFLSKQCVFFGISR